MKIHPRREFAWRILCHRHFCWTFTRKNHSCCISAHEVMKTFDKKIILFCVLLYLKLYFSDIYRFFKYLSMDNRVELNIKDLHKQKFNVCCLLYDGVMKNWKLFIHFLIWKINTKFIWIDRYSDKGFISGKQVVLSNHRQVIQIPAFYIVCSIYSFGCVVHRLYIGHNKMCWYVKCVNDIWYFAKSRKRLKMEFLDTCVIKKITL